MIHYVITSFNQAGYNLYAKNFINTFLEFWCPSVKLIVTHENVNGLIKSDRIHYIDLLKCTKFNDFVRNNNNEFSTGKSKFKNLYWKPAAIRNKYNYRYDALKFGKKIIGMQVGMDYAYQGCPLPAQARAYWLDADIVTLNPVPVGMLETLTRGVYKVARLYRGGSHYSECGFVAYDISCGEVRGFINDFADVYHNKKYYGYVEWHDSYIFDMLLKHQYDITCYNIPHTNRGHPLINSFLGVYFDHLKGEGRKSNGSSFRSDYIAR